MSDSNKNYTVSDLMGEFFSTDGYTQPAADGTVSRAAETSAVTETSAVAETSAVTETSAVAEEEISAADIDTDDVEVVSDILEEDTSESQNADITVAGNSEWETLEIAETVSEIFDESNISESISVDSCGDSVVCENKEEMEENVGNKKEMGNKTEIPDISKTETEKNQEIKTENIAVSELSDKSEEDIDKDFNESFIKRFLKGIIPWKGDSACEVIRKIIFISASAVFIGAGCMLVSTLIQSRQAVEQKEKDREIIVTTAATAIDESGNVITIAPTDEEVAEHRFNVAEYYKGINEDYVGYLELSGCDIAEPIVKGENNDYYLTHAIHGGTNKAGTVFMDYRCTFTGDYISPNIVFYGHNQEDGTMFGNLKEYKQNVTFYEENPVVKFSTENETYEYLIYGFFVTNALEKQDSNGEVFHYQDYIETMSDENTFDWYLDMVYERNQIVSPVDVVYGDKLLCLSTCSNEFSNSRFVIFARMLREGESIDDYDFSETYLNPYARGVDWEAIMSGETSATEEEILDEDDEDEIVGNGFLETAVHVKRNPAVTETETTPEAETTVVPDDESKSETEGETTTKKRKKNTSETEETAQTSVSETSGLEEATRKKKKTSETSADISESRDGSDNGETVTRSSSKNKKQGTETEPAETAPPQPEDGSSETVTAG